MLNKVGFTKADLQGPSTTCQEDSCANMGICIQQWENYTCDCSMTSYTGAHCNDRLLHLSERIAMVFVEHEVAVRLQLETDAAEGVCCVPE
ncbi:hypothetical protein DNTS_024414 [Danionella cerebrum]|uniref:EGF-like domain-containing protein n=1 Tax=Danionella cerebrum TaxID=2873325 RepID=A0A553RDV2_9TELE|nr:hypothetical protein DNTS_024414 [Danionella translucida]